MAGVLRHAKQSNYPDERSGHHGYDRWQPHHLRQRHGHEGHHVLQTGRFMTPIKNMGPKSRVWLHEIGINTLEDLQTMGAVEAYRRLKTAFPIEITLNMLWGLQAAILNIPLKMITPEMKAELKAKVEK